MRARRRALLPRACDLAGGELGKLAEGLPAGKGGAQVGIDSSKPDGHGVDRVEIALESRIEQELLDARARQRPLRPEHIPRGAQGIVARRLVRDGNRGDEAQIRPAEVWTDRG